MPAPIGVISSAEAAKLDANTDKLYLGAMGVLLVFLLLLWVSIPLLVPRTPTQQGTADLFHLSDHLSVFDIPGEDAVPVYSGVGAHNCIVDTGSLQSNNASV